MAAEFGRRTTGPLSRFAVAVLSLLLGVIAFAAHPAAAHAPTTTAGEAKFTYDLSAVARVHALEFISADARPTQLSDLREPSSSPVDGARGTSTTSIFAFLATESAGTRFVAGSDGVVTDLVGGSPNSVVLGKYPAYVNQAAATGSRAFSISDEAWNAMTEAEQWVRNQQFLDQAITRGSDIQLATAPTAKNLTGFYAKEINYLTKQGYTMSSDGTRMIPPGG
jgi:hypothetical protein